MVVSIHARRSARRLQLTKRRERAKGPAVLLSMRPFANPVIAWNWWNLEAERRPTSYLVRIDGTLTRRTSGATHKGQLLRPRQLAELLQRAA
jgi:hypothetical protein